MTKHDIRIRRGSFSKGQIERHKDFKAFSGMIEKERNKSISQRMWIVLIGVIFMLAMAIIGYVRITKHREQNEFKVPQIEQTETTSKQ